MILFWNKAEVFIGYSIRVFNEARDILQAAQIESTYKIVNHEGSRSSHTLRSRTGSGGIQSGSTNLYSIYVHKKQREEARKVLGKLR